MPESWAVAKEWWHDAIGLLTASLFKVNTVDVTIISLLQFMLIVFAAWWISKGLQRTLVRLAGSRHSISPASLYTLGRLLHYVIIALAILFGLSSIGLNFSNLALLAGAIGVGLGFGLQTLINNFVSGIMLLIERSLKVGDFVELESGVTGEVREINIRSTLITTNDNVDILVPNSEFISGRMTNWTLRDGIRRARYGFGVAYGTPKEKVREAGLEAIRSVPHTLEDEAHQPDVWLEEFGDSSVNYQLVVWLKPDAVKRPARVRADYMWALDTALAAHGIEIPFPQRDLHLRSGFELLRGPAAETQDEEPDGKPEN